MVRWICVRDRNRLDRRGDGLACPDCGRTYGSVEGAPIFAPSAPPAPLLAEISRLMEQRPAAEVAEAFCEERDCAAEARTATWAGFIPVPAGGRVLEIGAGFGDDTLALARRASEVIGLVPHPLNATIVRRRLDEHGTENVALAVVDDLRRLPLEEHSVDTIALAESAAGSFRLSAHTLPDVVVEWKRVLRPSGRVALGLGNRLHGAPGFGKAWSRWVASGPTETLNERVRRGASDRRVATLGLRNGTRVLREQGLRRRRLYAPLPDAPGVEIVVPIEDVGVVRYCFSQLLRQNAWPMRAAIAAVTTAARLDLLRSLVPYYYAIFEPERARIAAAGPSRDPGRALR